MKCEIKIIIPTAITARLMFRAFSPGVRPGLAISSLRPSKGAISVAGQEVRKAYEIDPTRNLH